MFNLSSLQKWFRANQRDLPWRDSPSPYAVWVSEIMLQQTQVKTVIPYFYKWMELFPSIKALAEAPEEIVIKAWEGLGYYSRARSLLNGAKQCVQDFKSELPSEPKDLASIKGIGPYTQGAILSFAFKKKAAAIDGNVLRVISRLSGSYLDISKQTTRKEVEKIVLESLPSEKPWEAMEALIELGALVCGKKAKCHECPLSSQCRAYKESLTEILPIKKKNAAITYLTRHTFLILSQNMVLLKKGDKGQVMADLWEFPYFEGEIPEQLGSLKLDFSRRLKSEKHGFTRYSVELIPYIQSQKNAHPEEGYTWIPLNDIQNLPFSSGHRKLLVHLPKATPS